MITQFEENFEFVVTMQVLVEETLTEEGQITIIEPALSIGLVGVNEMI